MPRGGARQGAGAKRSRPPTDRRVMLELSSGEAAVLERLQQRLELSAADVLRRGLVELYSSG